MVFAAQGSYSGRQNVVYKGTLYEMAVKLVGKYIDKRFENLRISPNAGGVKCVNSLFCKDLALPVGAG
jgi:hypothetical protein